MFGTPKLKLTNRDKQKIQARFNAKLDEFKAKTDEELKTLMSVKMSSTDKTALDYVIDHKIKANVAKEMESNKQIENNDIARENTDEASA